MISHLIIPLSTRQEPCKVTATNNKKKAFVYSLPSAPSTSFFHFLPRWLPTYIVLLNLLLYLFPFTVFLSEVINKKKTTKKPVIYVTTLLITKEEKQEQTSPKK